MEKQLYDFVKSQLKSLNGDEHKEMGIFGGKIKPAERVLGVEVISEGRLRVNISSDEINLNNKIALETHLYSAVAKEFKDLSIIVNFTKIAKKANEGVNINMPSSFTQRKRSPFGLNIEKRAIPGVKSVICVASGKGGVGKSTISSNLAVGLKQKGHKVGLLDADIYGPSAPMMLGVKGTLPISPEQKILPLEGHGVKCVSFGFMSDSYNPVIWRGPLVSKAIEQFLYDVDWGELDYLVLDLPPGTGDVQMSLIENVPIHSSIIVTTPQDVALIDAHKALTMFEKLDVSVLGIVENMSTFKCGDCGSVHKVFGDGGVKKFCEERGIPLLSELPLNPEVGAYGDSGNPAILNDALLKEKFEEIINVVERKS